MVHVVQSIVFPALLLIVYSFVFTPYWAKFQGNSHGPLYARRETFYGNFSNVYLPEYHLHVYDPMLTIFVTGLAIIFSALMQLGLGFIDSCAEHRTHARKIIYVFLATWILVLHLVATISFAATLLVEADWCYYLVASVGTIVTVANFGVSIAEYRSEKSKIP